MVWVRKEESGGLNFKNNVRICVGVILLLAFITAPFLTPLQKYLSIPNEIVTFMDQSSIKIPNTDDTNYSVKSAPDEKVVQKVDTSEFTAKKPGNTHLLYEAGGLPVKKVNVSVLDDLKIVPGGQSIGVQLHTRGVLVVGHHLVKHEDTNISPGEEADIKVGDVILKINDNQIKNMEDVKPLVKKAGKDNKKLEITLKRGNETIETSLKPIKDSNHDEYRIGLYIRDSAAGIGTMTFYEPKSKKYGALGHVISDMDTQKPIEIHKGTIMRSNITSIEKGNSGTPGEKQAKFSLKENQIGSITKNTPYGVFGKLDESLSNGISDEPMPIGLSHEVEEGPAKILTVVEGEEVEEFDVEIVNSISQTSPATKGMIVKITDDKLLDETGGIVQGMSGSPIIQNGNIVGAITHVFVNDPTSGYGVHIEWMLEEAGINIYDPNKKAG